MTADDAVRHLAATLLPGGAGFPAAADTAAVPLLLQRLQQDDPALAARVLAAVTARGAPPGDPTAWVEAAARLEALEPQLFDTFRRHAYLAYYEQAAVIAAIRAGGHPYNDHPLPDGYPTDPFDPARDAPTHGRGRWTATADVRPADTSALDLEPLR